MPVFFERFYDSSVYQVVEPNDTSGEALMVRTYPTLIRRFFACSLLLAASACASVLLETGVTAPDFHLQSQSGSEVSLKSYKGQWVILFFFDDHSSKDVELVARNLERDRAKFSAYNAVVVGIGRTSPESNQAWATKNEITFPLLSDPYQAIAQAYGVPVNSATGAGGKEIYETIVAPSGKVKLPRITDFDYDGESEHLLACLQVFKDHPAPGDGL